MVKLPKLEPYPALPSPPSQIFRWYQINRHLHVNNGPSTLIELEEFADAAHDYMSGMSNHPNIRQAAMNRIRQFFNLEFKMVCDVCRTAHYQDEITAPER